jgi:mannose-6-phosphate isomerase-like protein (cupin superfamily)
MDSMIEIQNILDCKRVNKPWGNEIWLQPGSTVYPYALKQLTLLAGQKTSLQVHEKKSESIIILSGRGYILYSNEPYDTNQSYSEADLVKFPIAAGAVFHTPPGTVHRMIAASDLVYIEASTTELDDVIRLQDDNNRSHGRIDSEHQ